MNKLIMIVLTITGLCACVMPQSKHAENEKSDKDANSSSHKVLEENQLNGIVSVMADELFKTRLAGEAFPVAVASFVNLETLDKTNWLGLQISENFIHELHRRGELVMDFKLTGVIQVTKSGDFVMSRDWKKLAKSMPISRVLTGTMSHNEEGIVVNARLINLRTRLVEATSQGFVSRDLVGGVTSTLPVHVTRGMIARGQVPLSPSRLAD